jgi:glycosyltransferase involved in cell wall biosynthesis
VDFPVRPLKLALVTRYYPPLIGGAEKVLSYLARALAVEGVEVTVLTSRIPGSGLAACEEVPIAAGGSATPMDSTDSGRLTVVRLETSQMRFWGTWRYMRNLRRWFRNRPVDLAYVSMLKHDAYVVVGVGKRLGFPVVLRPEGAGATGDVAWQSWGNFGRMIGHRCRRADAFVAISERVEGELEEALRSGTMRAIRCARFSQPPRPPRIVAVPNGVPVPTTAWQVREGWRAAPRAVFVGRLAPEKGLDTLLNAWPSVRSSYPEARLIIFGEGPERTALEARARALALTPGPGQAVELPGTAADVTEELRVADLFVLPSREEGMSIALLEAMALGIPLVASSVPGNCGLVSDFEHGRLAPVDDPGALSRVIVGQWNNFDRAVAMGCAARARVDREFSIQTVARRHLVLFDGILRERKLC